MSEENLNIEPAITDEKAPIEFPNSQLENLSVHPSLIINALKCIDAAAGRGAYQGGELSVVGGVRDSLYAHVSDIVEALAKQEKAKAEAK